MLTNLARGGWGTEAHSSMGQKRRQRRQRCGHHRVLNPQAGEPLPSGMIRSWQRPADASRRCAGVWTDRQRRQAGDPHDQSGSARSVANIGKHRTLY